MTSSLPEAGTLLAQCGLAQCGFQKAFIDRRVHRFGEGVDGARIVRLGSAASWNEDGGYCRRFGARKGSQKADLVERLADEERSHSEFLLSFRR